MILDVHAVKRLSDDLTLDVKVLVLEGGFNRTKHQSVLLEADAPVNHVIDLVADATTTVNDVKVLFVEFRLLGGSAAAEEGRVHRKRILCGNLERWLAHDDVVRSNGRRLLARERLRVFTRVALRENVNQIKRTLSRVHGCSYRVAIPYASLEQTKEAIVSCFCVV